MLLRGVIYAILSTVTLLTITSGAPRQPAFVPHGCSRKHKKQKQKHSTTRQQFQASSYLGSLSTTQQSLRTLYPSITPYHNASIQVSALHTIQYQLYGNPNGLPALFLHGGPGAGCFPNHARFFDPDKYCIVLLNQRGVNKVGKGEFRENTLLDLVGDCEAIRSHLSVPQWAVVLGGSWGSTLALAYAQQHPESVKSMILRGVCMLRPEEVNWLLGNSGVAMLDPDGYQEFCQAVNAIVTDDTNVVVEKYYHKLLSNDPVQRLEAAKGWMKWEMRVSSIHNEEKDASAPVLVGHWGLWEYQDAAGKKWIQDDQLPSPAILLEQLKRSVPDSQRLYQANMLPIQEVSPMVINSSSSSIAKEEYATFIPSQAMLTCFYSVNYDYCLNHIDLMCNARMAKVRSIPTIAIHGGLDTTCPVNNALDLSKVWPELELRLCSKAGHSMYDAAITNELIHATDRLAQLWETFSTKGVFE